VQVEYAFSPIDLIPDPIPILGYLDDLVLVPIGVALAIRMIPAPVLAECRQEARLTTKERPTNRTAAAIIVVLWLLLAALAILLMRRVM
jgi:uncharacterized membrane protein YkvA (DUF1232 family)